MQIIDGLSTVLDLSIVGFAMASVWLWWASGRHRVRRITRREELSAADINRLTVALNRLLILNARTAFMTACAFALAAIRLALDLA